MFKRAANSGAAVSRDLGELAGSKSAGGTADRQANCGTVCYANGLCPSCMSLCFQNTVMLQVNLVHGARERLSLPGCADLGLSYLSFDWPRVLELHVV